MNGLRILRQIVGIDPNTERNLRGDAMLIEYDDGTQWIDNDKPYDAVTAHEVVKHTGGFIVADEHGGKLGGPWRAVDKAEAARASAKVEIVSMVADEPDDEPAAASEGGGVLAGA